MTTLPAVVNLADDDVNALTGIGDGSRITHGYSRACSVFTYRYKEPGGHINAQEKTETSQDPGHQPVLSKKAEGWTPDEKEEGNQEIHRQR